MPFNRTFGIMSGSIFGHFNRGVTGTELGEVREAETLHRDQDDIPTDKSNPAGNRCHAAGLCLH